MTSRHGPVIIQTVFHNQHYTRCEAVLLARLVEAEIVSPYHGILINTDVGNLTMPVTQPPPSKASSKRSRGRLLVFSPFIMRPRHVPFLRSSIESAPCLEFQHPKLQIQALRTFDYVRLRPARLVDAFLRYGRRHAKAKRCQVSNQRNFA